MTPAANPMPRAADVDRRIGCAVFDAYNDVVGVVVVDESIELDVVEARLTGIVEKNVVDMAVSCQVNLCLTSRP